MPVARHPFPCVTPTGRILINSISPSRLCLGSPRAASSCRRRLARSREPEAMASPPPAAAAAAAANEPGALAPPLASDNWDDYHSRWDRIWRDGLAPGQFFDKASASPTLRSLLSLPLLEEQAAFLAAQGGGAWAEPPPLIDARGMRALVPGCGRGYDVVAFARAGAREAVGLELSPAAAGAARAFVARDLEASPDSAAAARIVEGDFFSPPGQEDGVMSPGSFDLGYDLTFLCALHPSMREAWAEGWAALLKPGGRLVTACYPIDASRDQNAGPPWPLTPQLYERLLVGHGEGGEGEGAGGGGGAGGSSGAGGRRALFRKVYLEPVPRGMSHPERAGQEWLGIWERL